MYNTTSVKCALHRRTILINIFWGTKIIQNMFKLFMVDFRPNSVDDIIKYMENRVCLEEPRYTFPVKTVK